VIPFIALNPPDDSSAQVLRLECQHAGQQEDIFKGDAKHVEELSESTHHFSASFPSSPKSYNLTANKVVFLKLRSFWSHEIFPCCGSRNSQSLVVLGKTP
jgi:hypothetical protein